MGNSILDNLFIGVYHTLSHPVGYSVITLFPSWVYIYIFIISLPCWVFIPAVFPQLGTQSYCFSPVGFQFIPSFPSWVYIHSVFPQLGSHLFCLSPVGYTFILFFPNWVYIYGIFPFEIHFSFSFLLFFFCYFSLRE